jgi:transposase
VVDAQGQVVREAKVSSEPYALIRFLHDQDLEIARVGLEAGPLSQWLHAGLVAEGFEAVLLETRHVKAALSAMTVKTDRRDARGIAHLLRLGWYRPVHAKSASAQEVRSLLTARKLIQASCSTSRAAFAGCCAALASRSARSAAVASRRGSSTSWPAKPCSRRW